MESNGTVKKKRCFALNTDMLCQEIWKEGKCFCRNKLADCNDSRESWKCFTKGDVVGRKICDQIPHEMGVKKTNEYFSKTGSFFETDKELNLYIFQTNGMAIVTFLCLPIWLKEKIGYERDHLQGRKWS